MSAESSSSVGGSGHREIAQMGSVIRANQRREKPSRRNGARKRRKSRAKAPPAPPESEEATPDEAGRGDADKTVPSEPTGTIDYLA